MDKINFIIDSFKEKKIILILISYQLDKNNIIIEFQQGYNKSVITNKFIKIENSLLNQRLNDKQLTTILEILQSEIKNYKKRTIFIIFNEYFFARTPISESERNTIINLFSNQPNNDNELLFLMNFLYQIKEPLKNEEKEDLKIYLSQISCDVKLFKLNVSKDTIFHDDIDIWFTNESVLVYNKKIIFSQKKQAYYGELKKLRFNFSLGFGGKQTNLNSKDPEYILYKYLDSDINIDICLDIQNQYSFKRKKFMNESISYLSESDQEIIRKIRNIFKKHNDGQDYDKKNFYIIQSNTTNIYGCLQQFPNKTIIIQVDPKSSGIFRINYTKGFDNKISHLRDKIKKFHEQLYIKNKSFGEEDFSIDKIAQEIELSRTKNKADEEYDILIDDLFQPNFYNITEVIRPENTITQKIDDIKLEILKYDLNKIKFD